MADRQCNPFGVFRFGWATARKDNRDCSCRERASDASLFPLPNYSRVFGRCASYTCSGDGLLAATESSQGTVEGGFCAPACSVSALGKLSLAGVGLDRSFFRTTESPSVTYRSPATTIISSSCSCIFLCYSFTRTNPRVYFRAPTHSNCTYTPHCHYRLPVHPRSHRPGTPAILDGFGHGIPVLASWFSRLTRPSTFSIIGPPFPAQHSVTKSTLRQERTTPSPRDFWTASRPLNRPIHLDLLKACSCRMSPRRYDCALAFSIR